RCSSEPLRGPVARRVRRVCRPSPIPLLDRRHHLPWSIARIQPTLISRNGRGSTFFEGGCMRWMIALGLCGAALGFAGEAEGQEWRELVVRQLDTAGEVARSSGQTDANVLSRNQVIGVLEDGATS